VTVLLDLFLTSSFLCRRLFFIFFCYCARYPV
jgi:hypothetical protein